MKVRTECAWESPNLWTSLNTPTYSFHSTQFTSQIWSRPRKEWSVCWTAASRRGWFRYWGSGGRTLGSAWSPQNSSVSWLPGGGKWKWKNMQDIFASQNSSGKLLFWLVTFKVQATKLPQAEGHPGPTSKVPPCDPAGGTSCFSSTSPCASASSGRWFVWLLSCQMDRQRHTATAATTAGQQIRLDCSRSLGARICGLRGTSLTSSSSWWCTVAKGTWLQRTCAIGKLDHRPAKELSQRGWRRHYELAPSPIVGPIPTSGRSMSLGSTYGSMQLVRPFGEPIRHQSACAHTVILTKSNWRCSLVWSGIE